MVDFPKKFSQIDHSTDPMGGGDYILGVANGTRDVLFSPEQVLSPLSVTRAQIPTTNLGTGTFMVSGFYAVGDGGAGAIYTSAGATSGGPMAIQDSVGTWFNLIVNRHANVCHFGAKGDGVNDFAAITAANDYIDSVGGGAVYFPPGHYTDGGGSSAIIAKNYTTYYGAGYSSFIDFRWNCFEAPGGGLYRAMIAGLTYYAAGSISEGDEKVTTTTPSDAGNFAVGDIVFARSTAAFVDLPGDTLPYYIEINRVTAVNASTGVITLEDPIEDAWTTGVKIAKATAFIAQNAVIRNLRLRSDFTVGAAPVKINGAYKCIFENGWSSGAEFIACNGWSRSDTRDIVAEVFYNVATIGSAFELAVGSVRATAENCHIFIYNADGTTSKMFPVVLAEFSRRTKLLNLWLSAPEVKTNTLFQIQEGGGHEIEDIHFDVFTSDLLLGYGPPVAGLQGLSTLPCAVHNIYVDCHGGFDVGVQVAGSNFDLDTFIVLEGVASTYGISLAGDSSNISFNNVRINGVLTDASGSPPYVFSNVTFTNCCFNGISPYSTTAPMNGVFFYSNTRFGTGISSPQRLFGGVLQNPTTPNNVLSTITIPANSIVTWGDLVKIDGLIYKGGTADVGTIEIAAFGSALVSIPIPNSATPVEFHFILSFQGNTFASPNLAFLLGSYNVGGTITSVTVGANYVAYNPAAGGAIEFQAWLASASDNFAVVNSLLAFVPNENGSFVV